MSRIWTIVAGLALLSSLAACGGTTADDVASDLADAYNDMADILEDVDDEASLEAARADMRDIAKRLSAMRDDWEELAETGGAEWADDMPEDLPELMAAQQRMTAAFMRVGMNPALQQQFSEVMQEFGEAFEPR
ncbi:MAG: hypothetical protein ACYTCU_08885 [Planctomycetota bacterium]|jgi:hypothetical protein